MLESKTTTKTPGRRTILAGMVLCCALWTSTMAANTLQTDTIKGKASYYSDALHGHRMSNGEKYHRDSMTCAHLKYPLGTMLKVKNLTTHKEVIVKVTDRGPHVKKYIIDLSRAAAKEIGMLRAGFCMVEITPWHKNIPPYLPEDDEEEIPELNLDYVEAATYPEPAWQRDSVKTMPANTRATVLPKSIKVKTDEARKDSAKTAMTDEAKRDSIKALKTEEVKRDSAKVATKKQTTTAKKTNERK